MSVAVAATGTVPDTSVPESGVVRTTDGGVMSPSGSEYVISTNGRSVASGCSMLAK